MTTLEKSNHDYMADALVFVHGELAPLEARRQLALNLKSGDKRNADLWQRVSLVVDAPRGDIRTG